MGLLVRGEWKDVWYDTDSTGGAFKREAAKFREQVSDAPGARFRPEAGRYHLYVSYACPWASRALAVRALKGLERAIGVTAVDPFMGERGWAFSPGEPDPLYGLRYLHELYTKAVPDFTGRVTVPVLWDTREQTIVNNESSEIIRLFNGAFNAFAARPELDLYPEPLRADIDRWNDRIYPSVNNGVYRAGFATTQAAYDEAVRELFAALDELEAHLGAHRYLVGDRPTEADWRLFTTLVRFDWVYYGHFKCNLRRLVDYPNLFAYTCELYQQPGIAATVNERHIKEHYYRSHPTINPTRIVPAGPPVDFGAPHGRG
ncbi:MAG TPA: glutathione S-transferase family protein [Polyangiaceae bacterium]|nr:glutathione S-transferase family protein [Polyangiaceae bacterium]